MPLKLSYEEAHRLFEYRDGKLYWKEIIGSRVPVGHEAGRAHYITGRRSVGIRGKKYQNHRIIFLMHHGYMPRQIDHIDNNHLNNRIENLRPATASQNLYNRSLFRNNTSGYKGVGFNKRCQKWYARITVNKKVIYLGLHNTAAEAGAVADAARNLFHKEFAKHA